MLNWDFMDPANRPPSIDRLARDPALSGLPEWIRLTAARRAVRLGKSLGESDWVTLAREEAERLMQAPIRAVINMSGIILHTGLGRARLAPLAQEALEQVSNNHATVEFDHESGRRGDRQDAVRGLLRQLTGAESSLVVNNCASSVFLTLSALAAGGEVLLSRGQMVEIGGAFRMPTIIESAGCTLREVGCTNRTHVKDFEAAIGPETRAILRCHTSNFRQTGFVCQPTPRELATLAEKAGVPFFDDLGSGCILDTERFGLPHERTLTEALQDGADAVMASGDKLLGGPQAGLILGRADLIERISRHPLARVVRIDKLSLAALEATLRLYLESKELTIPTWWAASRPIAEIEKGARWLASRAGPTAIVAEGTTELGGGSLPEVGIPTWRVGFTGPSPDEVLKWFRTCRCPIIGYARDGVAWFDPRTVTEVELELVAELFETWKNENGR